METTQSSSQIDEEQQLHTCASKAAYNKYVNNSDAYGRTIWGHASHENSAIAHPSVQSTSHVVIIETEEGSSVRTSAERREAARRGWATRRSKDVYK